MWVSKMHLASIQEHVNVLTVMHAFDKEAKAVFRKGCMVVVCRVDRINSAEDSVRVYAYGCAKRRVPQKISGSAMMRTAASKSMSIAFFCLKIACLEAQNRDHAWAWVGTDHLAARYGVRSENKQQRLTE
jgi:hypothetical protein